LKVNTLTEREDKFSLVGTARQRFRLLGPIVETDIETGTLNSALLYLPKVEVQVLADVELPELHYDASCSFNRLNKKMRTRYLRSVLPFDPTILSLCSTENTVQHLALWLRPFFDQPKLDRALECGLTAFSFWVAANLPISWKEKLDILEEECVDRRLRTELKFLAELPSLACGCGSEKMEILDLISLNSEAMGSCYVNPHGYVHDMFTVRRVQNVSYSGRAHTEFSWFPGYSWTVMNCSTCGAHMGWKFKSRRLKPAKFYGINRSAIKSFVRDENA